jgi:hypothetical protein
MQSVAIRIPLVFGIFLLLAGLNIGQERFESGKYKGFIKYSAFAIVELQDSFTVREAKGVVLFPNSNDSLPNVVVEFRDADGKIRATKTKLKNAPRSWACPRLGAPLIRTTRAHDSPYAA